MKPHHVAGLILVLIIGSLIWIQSPEAEDPGTTHAKPEQVFVASSRDKASIPWNIRGLKSPPKGGNPNREDPALRRSQPETTSGSMATIRVFGNTSVSAELIAAHITVPGDTARDEIEALIWNQVSALFTSLGLVGTAIRRLEMGDGNPPTIELEIEEGEFYRYGTVGLAGDGETILGSYPLPESGDPVNYPRINDFRAQLKNRFADLGYLDAEVVPNIRPDHGSGTLDLTLHVTQGQRYLVGRISAPAGLFLPLQPGDYYLQSLLRAYLESQGISAERLLIDKDADSSQVHLTIAP